MNRLTVSELAGLVMLSLVTSILVTHAASPRNTEAQATQTSAPPVMIDGVNAGQLPTP